MNTTKLLITFIFIGLLATSSYFLFSSSESTPEVVANEGPSQDFIEVTRTPSVPCRPLTFTDAHWSVDIQGMNNCSTSVNSTFDVNWQIQQKGPLQPKQYDFIAFSMPHTVRFNGTGFLMLPPQVKLPFGFQFADDQMRVLFPLYLPQSQTTQGTFQIRPLVAGEFTLNWAYLVVNEKGDIVFSSKNTDTAMTFEIQERKNPKLVVQDRVGIEKPEKVLLSPSREYEVHVFEDRFQVLYANTKELLFERAGKEPNFSPGSRFLGYEPSVGSIEILDLLNENIITQHQSFQVIAWSKNDSFLIIGFSSWGDIEMILPFLEENNSIVGERGCHACDAWETSQLAIDLKNGLVSFRTESTKHWNTVHSLLKDNKNSLTERWIEDHQYSRILKVLGFPIPRHFPKLWEIKEGFELSHIAYEGRGMKSFFNAPLSKQVAPQLIEVASFDDKKGVIRGHSINRGIVSQLVEDISQKDYQKISKSLLKRLDDIGFSVHQNSMPLEPENDEWIEGQMTVKNTINSIKANYPLFQELTYSKILSNEACVPWLREYEDSMKYQLWQNKSNKFLLVQAVCNGGAGSTLVLYGDLFLFSIANNHRSHSLSLRESLSNMIIHSELATKKEDSEKYFQLDYWSEEKISHEIRAFLSDNNILLLASMGRSSAFVFDANTNKPKALIQNIQEIQDIESLHLSENGKLVLQINEGGRFYLYDIASQQRILNGLYIDDEIVLYTDEGFYDGTREGTYYITWHYPGLKQHFTFNQFESQFKRPDLIKAILNGQPVNKPKVQLLPPPSVEMVLNHAGNYAQQATIELTASSIRSLSNLRVFVDGTPVAEIPVSGRQAQTTVPIELKRGKHWITAVAYNDQGYSSIPERVSVDASKIKAKGSNLYVLGVGIDRYPNLPAQKNLDYAKQDIIAFADTVKANPAQQYETIVVKQLLDQQATANNIQQALRDIIQQATADDTIMLYFAGHGDKGRNDKFYFLTPQAAFTDFETTALTWEKVATLLAQAKAKVVVFLDACHSGVASQETVVPNDEYVTELMKAGKAGMVIIAASKGRQSSREGSQFGGGHGVFNYMITQALTTNRSTTDVNNNGIIELEELYRSVKYNVRKRTNGEQTPWISRNEIIGEMPLL
jgi:hypothetical protein